MQVLLKENQTLLMFGFLAVTYSQTGLVVRLPPAILATGLAVFSLLLVTAGLIVDSVAKARVEVQRRVYLGLPATEAAEGQVVRSAHR